MALRITSSLCSITVWSVRFDSDMRFFVQVKQYMEKTHGQTHYGYKLELLNVFKLQREGENDRFQNVRYLIYG